MVGSSGGVGCLAIWGLKMEEALGRPFVTTGLVSEIVWFTGTWICCKAVMVMTERPKILNSAIYKIPGLLHALSHPAGCSFPFLMPSKHLAYLHI